MLVPFLAGIGSDAGKTRGIIALAWRIRKGQKAAIGSVPKIHGTGSLWDCQERSRKAVGGADKSLTGMLTTTNPTASAVASDERVGSGLRVSIPGSQNTSPRG